MYQQQYQQGGYAPQNQGGYAPQNQNVYVGSAKFQNGQYGLMVSVSLKAEDIAKLQANLNQNGWVSFSLRERQQPSQSGATHYGVIRLGQNQGGYAPPQNQGGYRQAPPPQHGYQQRPPQNQGGYRQGPPQYQQPAPPPPQNGYQQGYDNGGFNQAPPPPPQYQQPAPPPPQNPAPAPAAPGNEHRYTPADAQPPAADDGQEPPIENGMPF